MKGFDSFKVRSFILAGSAGVLMFGGVVAPLPASAVDTAVTVEVTGGALEITVPTGPVDLGTLANTVGGDEINGPLGEVVVSDARSAAAGAGWVATVISTALTPPSGPTIPASALHYEVGDITKVGTATYTPNNPEDLTAVKAAVTATGITGDNSATWTPSIVVAVDGGTAAAVYTGTITHSVS